MPRPANAGDKTLGQSVRNTLIYKRGVGVLTVLRAPYVGSLYVGSQCQPY